MKKAFRPQWYLVALTLAAALVGLLVRSSQLKTELSRDGQLVAGASLHIVLLVLSLVTVGGLIGLLLPLEQREDAAILSGNIVNAVIVLLVSVGLLVSNVILFLRGPEAATLVMTQSPKLSAFLFKLLSPLGILSGFCVAAIGVLRLLKKPVSAAFYMLVCLYLTVRLVICFQAWNADPSIHDYCFQLLAAICCMLATLQLAGFLFGKGRRRIALFWCLGAVVFCAISLPDASLRSTADVLLLQLSLLVLMGAEAVQLLFCKVSSSF